MAAIRERAGVAPQPFETDILGVPVWRLDRDAFVSAPMRLGHVIADARGAGVGLIACRIAAGDALGPALANVGFRRIEVLVTFVRDVPHEKSGTDIALAEADDAEACAQIAADVFRFDRYHADPALPAAAADEIKRRWVLNGVRGRADASLIVRDEDGCIAGFNLCMRRGADAVIDLIGVARAMQGRGLGRRLVLAALDHYAGRARRMWVGTQSNNAGSIALYERCGFMQAHAAETWHWTP